MSEVKPRSHKVRFLPREQFAFGWLRMNTTHVTIDTVMFGPWKYTLFRVSRELMESANT